MIVGGGKDFVEGVVLGGKRTLLRGRLYLWVCCCGKTVVAALTSGGFCAFDSGKVSFDDFPKRKCCDGKSRLNSFAEDTTPSNPVFRPRTRP